MNAKILRGCFIWHSHIERQVRKVVCSFVVYTHRFHPQHGFQTTKHLMWSQIFTQKFVIFFFVVRSILFVFNVCMPQNFGLSLVVDGYRIGRNDGRKIDVNEIDEISCHLRNRIESAIDFVAVHTWVDILCLFDEFHNASPVTTHTYVNTLIVYVYSIWIVAADLGSDV